MNPLSSPFPDQLPGFNVAFGLRQCIGDHALLVHLTKRFWEDYAGFAEALETEGDRHKRARMLHELRGVAINLGFTELSELCFHLRGRVISGSPIMVDEATRFREELETIGASIKTLDNFHQN